MKISVDAAMRARDVSQPGPADAAAAERAEAAIADSRPRPAIRPAASSQAPAARTDLDTESAARPSRPQSEGGPDRRAAADRRRGRRRHAGARRS